MRNMKYERTLRSQVVAVIYLFIFHYRLQRHSLVQLIIQRKQPVEPAKSFCDRDFKVKLNLCQTFHVFGNGKRKQNNLAVGISAFCDVTECQER